MKLLPIAAAATALLALSFSTHARDANDGWPEGSAMHTLHLESERLETLRTRLGAAHDALLTALGGNTDDPSPLVRPLAAQHARWLAYRQADCELAGILTGAGGNWPSVHGLGCQIEHLTRRLEVVEQADACLHALPAGSSPYEQEECLRGMVDWSMGEA